MYFTLRGKYKKTASNVSRSVGNLRDAVILGNHMDRPQGVLCKVPKNVNLRDAAYVGVICIINK